MTKERLTTTTMTTTSTTTTKITIILKSHSVNVHFSTIFTILIFWQTYLLLYGLFAKQAEELFIFGRLHLQKPLKLLIDSVTQTAKQTLTTPIIDGLREQAPTDSITFFFSIQSSLWDRVYETTDSKKMGSSHFETKWHLKHTLLHNTFSFCCASLQFVYLRQDPPPWIEFFVIFDFFAQWYRRSREASSVKIS